MKTIQIDDGLYAEIVEIAKASGVSADEAAQGMLTDHMRRSEEHLRLMNSIARGECSHASLYSRCCL